MTEIVENARSAAKAARQLADAACDVVALAIAPEGRIESRLADRHQRLVHGFAWIATTAEALAATVGWAERAKAVGSFGEIEQLTLQIGFGEYCAQLIGGLPMSQSELVRPAELGLVDAAARFAEDASVAWFVS